MLTFVLYLQKQNNFMGNFIAIDIETSGLYPKKHSKIFCCAVNTGKTIKVYENILQLKPILEDKNITKIIHNAAFDSFWFRRLYNIRVTNIWDTQLAELVLLGESLQEKETANNKELMLQSSAKLGWTLQRYGLATLNKDMSASFATRSLSAPLTKAEIEYVKKDVEYLPQLQAMQEYRLAKLGLMQVMNLENKVVEVVVEMRNRGIGFSKLLWLTMAKSNLDIYNELLKRLPPTVTNWNSHVQVKKYFNSIGIPVQSLTGIEEFLTTYNDPTLQKFVEMRSTFKNATTYGASWLQDDIKQNTVDEDNRVRADFWQIVNTGRFSCSHPNLQQLPKEGIHRSAFVPAKGKVFIIGDFTGQELGIMAAASQEEIWIKAMLRREDVHSLTASLLYPDLWVNTVEKGCVFPKKCKCKEHSRVREHAKVINFAIAYGAGPETIGKRLNLSLKEANRLLTKYKKVVPRLTRWLAKNASDTVATRVSYSADPYKRRRILRDPEDWMLKNIGKNNPVQSAGANMIKLAMISLHKDLPIVLTIHDEIILEAEKKNANKAAKELKIIMEKAADYCTGIQGLIEVTPRIATSLQK